MYQSGGLVYCIIDKDGYKTGVPIKASSIYTKPTLATLQKKFEKNQVTRLTFQKIVQAKVFDVLSKSNFGSMFVAKLREKNIHCSFQYENENIKEIRFVDHATRSVFSARSFTGVFEEKEEKANKMICLSISCRNNTSVDIVINKPLVFHFPRN